MTLYESIIVLMKMAGNGWKHLLETSEVSLVLLPVAAAFSTQLDCNFNGFLLSLLSSSSFHSTLGSFHSAFRVVRSRMDCLLLLADVFTSNQTFSFTGTVQKIQDSPCYFSVNTKSQSEINFWILENYFSNKGIAVCKLFCL